MNFPSSIDPALISVGRKRRSLGGDEANIAARLQISHPCTPIPSVWLPHSVRHRTDHVDSLI